MKNTTHILFSAGIGSIITGYFSAFVDIGPLFIFLLIIFGMLGRTSDWLDFRLYAEHERKFLSHSPFSPILIIISLSLGGLFGMIETVLGVFIAIASYIALLSHIFLDSLNPSKVPLLPNKRVRITDIPFDDSLWNLFLSLIGILLIVSGYFVFAIF